MRKTKNEKDYPSAAAVTFSVENLMVGSIYGLYKSPYKISWNFVYSQNNLLTKIGLRLNYYGFANGL